MLSKNPITAIVMELSADVDKRYRYDDTETPKLNVRLDSRPTNKFYSQEVQHTRVRSLTPVSDIFGEIVSQPGEVVSVFREFWPLCL